MPNKRDLKLASGFATSGGIVGVIVRFRTGTLYFCRSCMPELICPAYAWGCFVLLNQKM